MMDRLTVAVVQAGTPLFDTERTLEKVRKYCREAGIRKGLVLERTLDLARRKAGRSSGDTTRRRWTNDPKKLLS
jgi:hypothetical protein